MTSNKLERDVLKDIKQTNFWAHYCLTADCGTLPMMLSAMGLQQGEIVTIRGRNLHFRDNVIRIEDRGYAYLFNWADEVEECPPDEPRGIMITISPIQETHFLLIRAHIDNLKQRLTPKGL
jgi:hypothetical protein